MEERFEAFTVLIAALNRCIYKIKAEEMAELDLKSSHVSCLYYLYRKEPLTAKELCGLCGEDKANMSRTVRYLEGAGYIVCESNSRKAYQSALRLSEKGRRTGVYIAGRVDKILVAASAGLREEERSVMYRGLGPTLDNLEKICYSYRQKEKTGQTK